MKLLTPLRMVKFRALLYNAVLLAVVAPIAGCGGKPTPPPPGAEGENPAGEVQMGDESSAPSSGKPSENPPSTGSSSPPGGESNPSSSTGDKPPAADSGAK